MCKSFLGDRRASLAMAVVVIIFKAAALLGTVYDEVIYIKKFA